MVDFSTSDIGDDAAFMQNFAKVTGVKDGRTLRTSNADSEDNGIAMTSYSVSDILQGVHAYKPQGLATNAFNQLMTSQLQQVGTLNAETGANDVDIAQRLGSRVRFLPDDLMNGSFLEIVQNGGTGYDGATAPPGAAPPVPGNLGDTTEAGVNAINLKYTDTAGVTEVKAGSSPDGKGIMVGKYNGVIVNMACIAAWKAMVDHGNREGINLSGWGHREHSTQIQLRKEHCGSSNYAIYQMPSSSCHPPTARPGTSRHEWGTAIDIWESGTQSTIQSHSTATFQWLAKNAATYGFYNLPSESWHWSVNGS